MYRFVEWDAKMWILRDHNYFLYGWESSLQDILGMPHQDDGLSLLLCVVVCLFGSWVGSDKGATWQFHVGRGPLPLLNSHGWGEIRKIDQPHNSSWQVIGMPHQDDGPPLFLSVVVCLFGSWVGSDKGATWLFHVGRSLLPLLKHSEGRRGLRNSTAGTSLPLASDWYATPRWWTATASECCCMLVWVMNGLWQWCYVTISRWKESPATLETLRGAARFETSLKLRPPAQVFLASECHATPRWWTATVSECCCMFVWVMNGLWQ